MNNTNKSLINGVTMALAAAGLAACANTGGSSASVAGGGSKSDMIHCFGVNACKGHNDCKTADNACKGHASCEGAGFVAMPSKTCADVGGNRQDSWQGEIATADLSKCFGVNKCKGHNDCKTAGNSCKGHATCKGTGFVLLPGAACADVGGSSS